MNKEFIIKTVNQALCEEFELEAEQLQPETSFREDLHLDSLDAVDMIIALEYAFSFKLADRSQIKHVKTLQDVYDFIEKQHREGHISG